MSDPGLHVPSAEEQLEYEENLVEARDLESKVATVTLAGGKKPIWIPQNGSQSKFMDCPLFEVLYHGTRGPGKTDALIMSFAQHIGKGYGAAWRGIIFRQSYPQLADVQAKTEKWFNQIFAGDAKFNRTKMMWEWSTGEVLMLRHMGRAEDYWNYHGHEYPFIGWEEITNWADERCYTSMMACCRTSTKGVPRMIRATSNPYGPGHNWVKGRFRLTGNWRNTIVIMDAKDDEGRPLPGRCAIHGHIDENKILLAADPDYKRVIVASAANPAMAEAWLEGSWDIVAGGMFGDVWNAQYNIVPEFRVPRGWRVDRSFDWGSSAPFSVGWWAESDGSDLVFDSGRVMSTVRGDIFRIREWYGFNGKPNKGLYMLATEIAEGIVEREIDWGMRTTVGNLEYSSVRPGPADSAIFGVENGVSVGLDMTRPVRINGRVYKGVTWIPADKRAGSVRTGLEMMRKMMKDAHPKKTAPRERPGLFIVEGRCLQFERTIPSLARDEEDMDKLAKGAEDHCCDETRYRVRSVGQKSGTSTHTGMY